MFPLVRHFLISFVSRQKGSKIAFEEVFNCVKDAMLSHSRLLRLSTLQVLTSSLVTLPEETKEALLRCLQGEQVSIDVQGVRERVLKIGKVEQVLKARDDIGADLCARWLTGKDLKLFRRTVAELCPLPIQLS